MLTDLKADIKRNLRDYEPCSSLKLLALCLILNSIHALFLIRLQQWCAEKRLPTFPVAKLLFWFFSIEISKHATIGPGLRLPHPTGIIIAPNVTIGPNCDLYADVKLVLSHGNPKGPTLEEGVFMGDGAKAVGMVTLGAHSIIGVSAVVTKDVPEYGTAVGIPAKVINIKKPEPV
ncbi:serine O-acetyltransferase [Rubritalea marina]|uniref:serine O-acetyltransferase n=1 Tax=Rubritalea marina TaxID=361055 RepID=UPI000373B52F|nr:serine acetyltransferase [Rubritalea marina]